MDLVRTSLLNGVSVVVKLLTALGLNKYLAIYVGPSGYAVIGQFQNAISTLIAFASGALNAGVTKYTAEYFDEEVRQRAVWRTAGTIALCTSLLVSIVIAIFHQSLARLVFKDEAYAGVFLWLSVTLVLFVFNGFLLAILNGKKEIRRYVVVNIFGSFVSLVVTAFLARVWGLYGALVALAINQSIVCFVTVALCRRAGWFRFSHFIGRVDPVVAKNLAKFTLMALTSAAVVPVSQIIIRDHLVTNFGWASAGHWQAVTKISDMYLMLITSTLGVYYLPRLSEIRKESELRHEISRGYKIILPVSALGAGAIYLLRDWIVVVLFTPDFAPMRELFAWQLLGDVAKIGSWLLAYVMLGRAMVRTFIVTEIVFSASFIGLTMVLTGIYGLQGVTMGFFLNYVLYWLVMMFLIGRYFASLAHLQAKID